MAGAYAEALKFSPNNLYWSDAILTGGTITNTSKYLDGAEFKHGNPISTNPPKTVATYCNNVKNKGTKGYQYNLVANRQCKIAYAIKDPKLLLSCLDVEPAVNALMHAAKDLRRCYD